jgi:hypothetical protein
MVCDSSVSLLDVVEQYSHGLCPRGFESPSCQTVYLLPQEDIFGRQEGWDSARGKRVQGRHFFVGFRRSEHRCRQDELTLIFNSNKLYE